MIALNFIQSLLTGAPGNYTLAGIRVRFENTPVSGYSFGSSSLIHQVAEYCLKSRAFNLTTLASLHTFTHEMGHAVVSRLLLGGNPSITILTKTSTGYTSLPKIYQKYRLWFFPFITLSKPVPISKGRASLISASGPVVNMLFSSCQLVAGVALRTCIPWPLSIALSAGGSIWMFGELLYAVTSAWREDNGDFGQIRTNGKHHLMLATLTLVIPCALAIFASMRLL